METRKPTTRLLRQTGMYDGVLLVDKPSGPTSHDVVARIRRRFRFDKVGHGGTLDPQATGLLIVLIERGTKLSNLFLSSDKAYEGVMRLGIATDSGDADGAITRESDPAGVTAERVAAEIARFRGDILQTPPMVSAAKKDGVPLYKLARKGKVVERQPKLIHVYEFRMTRFELPRAWFTLTCSKGTYVRSLCADVGDGLGCGAHLEALRRTRSGRQNVADAMPLADILDLDREGLLKHIIGLHKFVGMSAAPPPGAGDARR